MSGAAIIRATLAAVALLAATQAQAGQDVPPPRAIRPVQSAFAAPMSMSFAASSAWREMPAVMEGWSADRHVPVAGFDRMTVCEARARMGAAAADADWADDGDRFAGLDSDDFAPEWETMR